MNLPLGKIAGSAVILQEGKILLLQRTSNAAAFPSHWTFPAGGIEESDGSIADTVIREVKEETNLDFVPKKKWNFYESTTNGKRFISLVYLGEWSGDIRFQPEEVVEGRFFSHAETLDLEIAFAYREVLDDLHLAHILE